jgi:cytochrome P450
MPTHAPIPRLPGYPVLGNLPAFRGDRVAFLRDAAARWPEACATRIGIAEVVILSSPELVHEVLVTQEAAFSKSLGLTVFARPLLGDGLLTSHGERHRRQRRLMAPAFVHKRIAAYAEVIAERAERAAARLEHGALVDADAEMMRLTLEIVGKTLFDAEVGSDAAVIGEALTASMRHIMRSLGSIVPIPPAVPTPGNLRYRREVRRLDEIVYRLIRERRRSGGDRGDFLSMLLLAQDEDDRTGMTDGEVRDEAMTIFLAGHETTANGLAWALYLLARNADVRDRLEREVDAALGGRAPTLDDLPRLPLALAIFKEAMRLYPPAYMVSRRALSDVRIGPHLVTKEQIVIVNILAMHRRADLLADPERFDPDRFTPDAEKRLPKHAYLPFGAGPRVCIGNHFALMEGQLALATLAQRVRFERPAGAGDVPPEPLITLRPRGGIAMRVVRRDAALARAAA